ncbi:unnamed protein product, partial [Cladocopium goreaui]
MATFAVIPSAAGPSSTFGRASQPLGPAVPVPFVQSAKHVTGRAIAAVAAGFLGRRPPRSCRCAEGAKSPSEPGGVIQDVEYVFVNSKEDEAEAMSEDVLQRVNTVSRAHQGLYKVPEGVPDTEHGVGAITGALTSFPTEHVFQVVGKTFSDTERAQFLSQVEEAVQANTDSQLAAEALSVQSRMGGRYTSVRIQQRVDAAEQIAAVLTALKRLPQV